MNTAGGSASHFRSFHLPIYLYSPQPHFPITFLFPKSGDSQVPPSALTFNRDALHSITMSVYSRTLCVSTLASILLHASTFGLAASAPLSLSNATASSSSNAVRARPRELQSIPQRDNDGWLHFDSFGLMLPMDGDQDNSDESLAACQDGTVECQQHDDSPPSQPDFVQGHSAAARRGLQPISGSRDLVKRNGTFGVGEDGQPVYSVIPEDDDDDETGDEDGEEESDEDDNASPEAPDAEDTSDLEKRSPSFVDNRVSFSTLTKRVASYVSSLFKRKNKSDKKSRTSSKRNRNKGKGKGKGRKSRSKKSKKGKGGNALEKLGSELIMKGATLL